VQRRHVFGAEKTCFWCLMFFCFLSGGGAFNSRVAHQWDSNGTQPCTPSRKGTHPIDHFVGKKTMGRAKRYSVMHPIEKHGEPPKNWGEPPQNWVTHPIVLPRPRITTLTILILIPILTTKLSNGRPILHHVVRTS
jgi:hypothetical protein